MNIYELIGFIIGDGNIYHKKDKRVYRLELCGNVEEDYDYFEQLSDFLFQKTKKKPLFFIRNEQKSKSLRIQFNNKKFIEELISMGLPIGKKTFSIKVPNNLLRKEKFTSVLRGLFEADGCLYFSKSKKGEYPTYPRVEIKTSSEYLVEQIKKFLENEGFIVYIKKPRSDRTFAICISGEKMLEKWRNIVGFSSLKNQTKYDLWKAKGFYIPYTPLKDRLKMCGDGTAATAVDF